MNSFNQYICMYYLSLLRLKLFFSSAGTKIIKFNIGQVVMSLIMNDCWLWLGRCNTGFNKFKCSIESGYKLFKILFVKKQFMFFIQKFALIVTEPSFTFGDRQVLFI